MLNYSKSDKKYKKSFSKQINNPLEFPTKGSSRGTYNIEHI